MTYVDLFCGIGGFHAAAKQSGAPLRCVLACDIDPVCQRVYEQNHGIAPLGDISLISSDSLPDHDLLFAGFPCQPFSIIGDMKGFEDARGTLFFEIARILEAKKPRAFILENVKMLAGHEKGRTLSLILATLRDLGYTTDWRILNALDYGLAQKRERVFIVGYWGEGSFSWPPPSPRRQDLSEILEPNPSTRYLASPEIREKRALAAAKGSSPTIWHENKSGSIGRHPYSCALRAGASHNYLLVDGERRLTEREMLRLQGFPESFQIHEPYSVVRRLLGNSVPVPVVSAVLRELLASLKEPLPPCLSANPPEKSSTKSVNQKSRT
jgi:DNA (cytosine-5)-methyltransferase 1